MTEKGINGRVITGNWGRIVIVLKLSRAYINVIEARGVYQSKAL